MLNCLNLSGGGKGSAVAIAVAAFAFATCGLVFTGSPFNGVGGFMAIASEIKDNICQVWSHCHFNYTTFPLISIARRVNVFENYLYDFSPVKTLIGEAS